MSRFDREKFGKYWRQTEVLREYQKGLFTFADMKLPYVFVAEHSRFKDRAVVKKGVVLVKKPQIVLPPYYSGPQFGEGFEQDTEATAAYIFRSMGLPYSHVTNTLLAEQQTEYGSIGRILERFDRQLESQENSETGLIKGTLEGVDISLMRYSIGLMIKSAPGNVSEYFDHLRHHKTGPIKPHEKITDEEIDRLFG